MIASLCGTLKRVSPNAVVLEVGGVGYQVQVSRHTLEALPAVDSEVFLHTFLQVKEDGMSLFGFATPEEKGLFQVMISLPKVGVKTALDILSTYSVAHVRDIVLKEDIARLTQVPGVGRKTAERILFEMKERLELLPQPAVARKPAEVAGDVFEQAVQGLVYLGTKYPVALRAVQRAAERLGKDAPVEELIKEGLKYRSS